MNKSTNQWLIDEMIALQPKLRRFARGLTGSQADADDVLQTAYERALGRLEQWQPGSRVDSWMYRIVRNVFLNRVSAENVRSRYASQVDPDTVAGRSDLQAERKMDLDFVLSKVQVLPEEQRSALLLIVVEGLSYKDAANVLDIPQGTLTSRIARARAALLVAIGDVI